LTGGVATLVMGIAPFRQLTLALVSRFPFPSAHDGFGNSGVGFQPDSLSLETPRFRLPMGLQ
jgi:hypothetical protein